MRREPTDHRPDYMIIADDLRAKITSGELAVGDEIPSHAALRNTWESTLPTAQKAVDVLKAEGYVAAIRGRGTYVIRNDPPATPANEFAQMLTLVHQRLDSLEETVRKLAELNAATRRASPPRRTGRA
ncbi:MULTISPECIES: winged helix-turn-helix domain-containing protein [unclassified Crossiella]|uniref:winged helix-turn-helix domain-containing protein n=1 Tax=unclassified Crossiella TaxID=2620835 RepID=UPI001FFE5F7F|nr:MULTISPECIES: winged helix-turn-helix domain-containing protein [unclassified Crossiella]MCK2241226.1 winged helix-turn-helix domain-containing protein [Crossiella sp. S99.2]MCK2253630.1 winged helix-turn-helix domain-containing protein [Crossiella sp. S99.1]